MHREIRRKDRIMPVEKAREILDSFEYGIMATIGADGQSYAIPLSFTVADGHIYIHCAPEGQKLDNLEFESRVCFCCVGNTQPVYDNSFSTYYESVVIYGKASKVEKEQEKIDALTALAQKYLPEHMDKAPGDISKSIPRIAVYKISIDHITGKQKHRK